MAAPSVRLVTDGTSIFQVIDGEEQLIDALKEGQLAFVLAIDEITREVEEDVSRFELDKATFLSVVRRSEDELADDLATGT